MADKQLLHELLEEQQEPFHLQSYIASRRSQFRKSSSAAYLQLGKRKPVAPPKPSSFCLFSFRESKEVRDSPFRDFPSPAAMSPCKSPISPVFLRVPPRTAALLNEAALRIQKRRQSKPKAQVRILGFGLFGAFLKRLKDRSRNKKRATGIKEIQNSGNSEAQLNKEMERRSRNLNSCRNFRLNRADSENCSFEQTEMISGCSLRETLLCLSPNSPFRLSYHGGASSSGCRTPDFLPLASPSHRLQQESANSETTKSHNTQGDEEEKEHCSPVSVLDSFFDDDGAQAEGELDSDCDSSYANVERVKQQLLYRLRRFEKLAELDPLELEKRLLETNSDDEYQLDSLESMDNAPFSPCREQDMELDVFNLSSSHRHNSNMKMPFSDTSKMVCLGKNEVWGRIFKKLESWKDVELIDMMVEMDFKNECDGWKGCSEQVEEATAEVELAIVGLLVEEVLEEMCSIAEQPQERI